jgi:hypothetical protein
MLAMRSRRPLGRATVGPAKGDVGGERPCRRAGHGRPPVGRLGVWTHARITTRRRVAAGKHSSEPFRCQTASSKWEEPGRDNGQRPGCGRACVLWRGRKAGEAQAGAGAVCLRSWGRIGAAGALQWVGCACVGWRSAWRTAAFSYTLPDHLSTRRSSWPSSWRRAAGHAAALWGRRSVGAGPMATPTSSKSRART